MIHHRTILPILVSILFTLTQCAKVSKDKPAYLRVSETSVSDIRFGEPTSNIYALHLEIGNENRGRWVVPFEAPMLSYGINTAFISPIIKVNNLSTAFSLYPFLKPISTKLNIVEGKVLDTTFQFAYFDDVNMLFNEDFEVTKNFSNSSISEETPYGKYCMKIDVDFSTNDSTKTSIFFKPFALSKSKETYLEFDYKMIQGVFTPVLLYTDNNQEIKTVFGQNFLLSNSKWTHVYWNYTNLIRQTSGTDYVIGFTITASDDNTKASVLLDNVKLLEK